MSVVQVAGAPLVTFDAIEPVGAQARLAVLTGEACLAQAGAAHVVAGPPVDTPAGLRAPRSERANGALVLAPAGRRRGRAAG